MSKASVHPARLDTEALLKQCTLKYTRRSGPGGQHRNKVETAVIVEHRASGIRAEASERRKQSENQKGAVFRLRIRMALLIRSSSETLRAPSPLWKSRCNRGRIQVNEKHSDFPALLAEALDWIKKCGLEIKEAATKLETTPSQLTKFIKKEPQAFRRLNEDRKSLGLRALH